MRIDNILRGPADDTDVMATAGGVCLLAGLVRPPSAIPCTALGAGNGPKDLVKITVDADGDDVGDGTVTATDGHPVWVENERKWLNAGALKPGTQLVTPDGARVAVIAVVAYGAVATVHNLDLDDIDTFVVVVDGTPILVHNAEACSILERRAKELHDLRRDGTVSGYYQWKLGTTAVVRTKKVLPDGTVEYIDVVAANGKGLTKRRRPPSGKRGRGGQRRRPECGDERPQTRRRPAVRGAPWRSQPQRLPMVRELDPEPGWPVVRATQLGGRRFPRRAERSAIRRGSEGSRSRSAARWSA